MIGFGATMRATPMRVFRHRQRGWVWHCRRCRYAGADYFTWGEALGRALEHCRQGVRLRDP